MKTNLAKMAVIFGIAGVALWLLSYAWVPFALTGSEGQVVRYIVIGGEVGAVAAGALGVCLGFAARGRSEVGSSERRLASRGLTVGALVLALILIPNILGLVLNALAEAN